MGKSAVPVVYDAEGNRCGNDKGHKQHLGKLHIEHTQNVNHRRTMNPAYTNLLAAVLGLKHNQPEHTHK